jgi:N-acetylmuramoyl-L-alanine amidase
MKKTHIVLHHSATTDGLALSYPAIRQTHLDKGWRNIGYQFVIETFDRSKDIAPEQYLAIVGRGLTEQSAGEWRCGFNKHGIHICFVGNFDAETPHLDLWRFSAPLILSIQEAFCIAFENIIGHRDIPGVSKSCPGEKWDMLAYRQMLLGWS